MATLASRQPYATAYNVNAMSPAAHYRLPPNSATALGSQSGVFTSPTESEFSESYQDNRDSVLDWDETRVGEWLMSMNCGQYADLFRQNHINGENLMDMDQATLKEIGVKKIGDRVRIYAQTKLFRSIVYRRSSKRSVNRHSLATLDGNATVTPPSSGSPKQRGVARVEKRPSRQFSNDIKSSNLSASKTSSRPASPMVEHDGRRRVNVPSPMEFGRKDPNSSYFSQAPQSARYPSTQQRSHQLDTPLTAKLLSPYIKDLPTPGVTTDAGIVGLLPTDKALIRVIYDNSQVSVVSMAGLPSTPAEAAKEIFRRTLRKGASIESRKGPNESQKTMFNESQWRAYCFYVLAGSDPNPTFCRKLGEGELIKICNDGLRSERGRLILRKIHAGEPDAEQLRLAARIAEQQPPEPPAIEVQPPHKSRSQQQQPNIRIEKLTGEPLPSATYPMSPASQLERDNYFDSQVNAASSISRNVSQASNASARARKLKAFYGARPPTELITQDLQSYFPEVNKEDMDRTVRMSIRRSRRLSRAVKSLSTMSSFSVADSLKDAPPLPTIADQWLREVGGQPRVRPLSVVRLGQGDSGYRGSVTSSILSPLDEEGEPDRKSYVSFSAESTTDYEDGGSSPSGTEGGSGSLNSRLSQFIAEDGEEEDEELMDHLEKDSWDDVKYMKGAMIGQGSFGTVFLALHAVTGELMAVKQVEMPSNTQSSAMDAKKNTMIEALKREILLLRDLKHPNIVQYLGSNSDEDHLNIFLEYVAGGSVATMLVNYGSLGETLIANFVRQILQGLNYLHSEDIIHRDIKGANILVDNKGTVKISDFGISKRVEASTLLQPGSGSGSGSSSSAVSSPHHPPTTSKAGSRAQRVSLQGSVFWMAPEVVRQTAYTKKADIWSLGCLIVEMFTGAHPHPNCTQLQAIFKIGGAGSSSGSSSSASGGGGGGGGTGGGPGEGARPDLPPEASEDAKEFLRRTFELEHEKRPSAEQLMGYAFCAPKG